MTWNLTIQLAKLRSFPYTVVLCRDADILDISTSKGRYECHLLYIVFWCFKPKLKQGPSPSTFSVAFPAVKNISVILRRDHQRQKLSVHNPDSIWHTNSFSSLAFWLDPLELLHWPLLDPLDISAIPPLCVVKSSLALLFLFRNIRLNCCLDVFL